MGWAGDGFGFGAEYCGSGSGTPLWGDWCARGEECAPAEIGAGGEYEHEHEPEYGRAWDARETVAGSTPRFLSVEDELGPTL